MRETQHQPKKIRPAKIPIFFLTAPHPKIAAIHDTLNKHNTKTLLAEIATQMPEFLEIGIRKECCLGSGVMLKKLDVRSARRFGLDMSGSGVNAQTVATRSATVAYQPLHVGRKNVSGLI